MTCVRGCWNISTDCCPLPVRRKNRAVISPAGSARKKFWRDWLRCACRKWTSSAGAIKWTSWSAIVSDGGMLGAISGSRSMAPGVRSRWNGLKCRRIAWKYRFRPAIKITRGFGFGFFGHLYGKGAGRILPVRRRRLPRH